MSTGETHRTKEGTSWTKETRLGAKNGDPCGGPSTCHAACVWKRSDRCISSDREADQAWDVPSDATWCSAAAEGGAAALSHGYEYDLVVVGGGSGGLACSKKAAQLGAKVSGRYENDIIAS